MAFSVKMFEYLLQNIKTRLASLHRPSLLFLGEVLNDTKKLICTFQRL